MLSLRRLLLSALHYPPPPLKLRGRRVEKKRGEENFTKDTPPKKGFWTPFVWYVSPPPSGAIALFFLFY